MSAVRGKVKVTRRSLKKDTGYPPLWDIYVTFVSGRTASLRSNPDWIPPLSAKEANQRAKEITELPEVSFVYTAKSTPDFRYDKPRVQGGRV